MILAFRLLAILIGCLLIYMALFLYEDQQGRVQSRLENFWIKIDDAKKYMLSRHIAFMRAVASLLIAGFDRVFGKRDFSIQSVGVSACYAAAASDLFIVAVSSSPNAKEQFLPSFFFVALLGTIPTFIRRSFGIKAWFLVFLFFAFNDFILPYFYMSFFADSIQIPDMVLLPILILLCAGLGVVLFTLSIVVMRKSLRRISKSESLVKMAVISMLNCIPVIALYIVFQFMVFTLGGYDPGLTTRLFSDIHSYVATFSIVLFFSVLFINVVFFSTAAIFIVISVLLLVHRISWPLFDRSVYALQKLEVAKRSKLLGFIGATLIIGAIGGLSWLEKVVEKFNPF